MFILITFQALFLLWLKIMISVHIKSNNGPADMSNILITLWQLLKKLCKFQELTTKIYLLQLKVFCIPCLISTLWSTPCPWEWAHSTLDGPTKLVSPELVFLWKKGILVFLMKNIATMWMSPINWKRKWKLAQTGYKVWPPADESNEQF